MLIATNHIAPSLVERIDAVRTTITGLLIVAVGLALLAWVDDETDYVRFVTLYGFPCGWHAVDILRFRSPVDAPCTTTSG